MVDKDKDKDKEWEVDKVKDKEWEVEDHSEKKIIKFLKFTKYKYKLITYLNIFKILITNNLSIVLSNCSSFSSTSSELSNIPTIIFAILQVLITYINIQKFFHANFFNIYFLIFKIKQILIFCINQNWSLYTSIIILFCLR